MANNSQNDQGKSNTLKDLLGVNETKDAIESKLKESLTIRSSLFAENGPCSDIPLGSLPENYFVAQEFNETRNDLRETLSASLNELDFSPISADDFMWTDNILCKISALIHGTPFGIYQLSTSQNRNVYLELGIAIGLDKPFVLVKDKEAIPAGIIQDIEYHQIDDYLSTRHQLGKRIENYVTSIGRYQLKTLPYQTQTLNAVISHWESDSIDITITVAKNLSALGYKPIIIGKRDQKLEEFLISEVNINNPEFAETRDAIFKAINSSRLCVFRVDKSSSPNNFVALGFAIGRNKRFLPIKHTRNEMPSDLNYLRPLDFSGYTDFDRKLKTRLGEWLDSSGNEKS